MKIVVDINHPAQVHFFKNFIWEMQKRGHEILVTASKKDLTHYLLNKYNFNCSFLDGYGNSIIKKILNIPILDLKMYRLIYHFKPDLFLGFGSIRAAHVAKLMGKPCINFDDDEYSYPYYHFFVDAVCGFSGFKKHGQKVIKINGFKELAYLHLNVFRPDPAVLEISGISPGKKFVLVRFVSWNAFHDLGRKGFDTQLKINLIKELSEYSPVFISSETSLPEELERYRLNVPPEKIHDFLYYATLLISDSQTMTTEAAVLGTPAVRCNSFVGTRDMGNFIELEEKYGLIYNFSDTRLAIDKARELIQEEQLKIQWQKKRENLLKEKIDVTQFMIWFVTNYPQSFKDIRNKSFPKF